LDSREAWDQFRARFRELEPEFLRGLNELLGRFNVSDRSNRFIVGDVVEYLIAAGFFALGILVLPRGANQNNFDLDALVGQLRARFSIKSTFSPASDIRMKNRLSGETEWAWAEPVIFAVQGLGLVFADPQVHRELADRLRDAGDAYVLPIRAIREHAARNQDCLIAANIPSNPRTGHESAARALFKEIFDHPAYPIISGFLRRTRANVDGTPIFEALDEARARHDRGELTAEQYEELVQALITRVSDRRDQA
jgi:hypothetical protein